MRAEHGSASSGGASQSVCRRIAAPPVLAMYWPRLSAVPGPVTRFRLCGQAPLIRLQICRRSAKYWAGVAGWPTLIVAAGPSGLSSWSSRSCKASSSSGTGGSSPGRAGASSLAPQGRAFRLAACGLRAARHWAGCRPPSKARGMSRAGAPGAADMGGCRQEGHRYSSSCRCAGQANTTGSRHAFCQAPPYCCWIRLPSPARHCGQYRVAEANTHGLASARGPHLSAVTSGAAHGYWPDMLLMHNCEASVAVSLVTRAKVPAGASSMCIRLRRAGWRTSRPAVRSASRVMIRLRSRSPGRGHRRRCCARACLAWLGCRLTGRVRAGWRGSRRLRRRGCARQGD